jgi:hypothetical protein
MDSPGLANMSTDEGLKHMTRGTLEALQNLLYLIRLDAASPQRVQAYVDQAEKVLLRAHVHPLLDITNHTTR